ncbi:MAG: DUF1501 domain-containing protein [Planctomycetes bacterium]|nr:DUF1501 domain-containing protein [Planctomycetota bacterium]
MDAMDFMTRRQLFSQWGLGLGSMALSSFLERDGRDGGVRRGATLVPRAKHVIYLHMAGSPSQLDLFDDKPVLRKYHGKECPQEYLEGKRFAFIKGVPKLLGSPFRFGRHGRNGSIVSELLPHFASLVDDVTIVRSMHTDQFNHAPAQLLLFTGSPRFGNPALGSWATYGLGTLDRDLPGYVVFVSGGKKPSAGKSLWGSGFLPSSYQGVQCRSPGEPVLYLENPQGLDAAGRRRTLDAMARLNARRAASLGDPEVLERVKQYELAFRMQTSVPEVMDLTREPPEILAMYGARPGARSVADTLDDPRIGTRGDDPAFANHCLLARRLVERGVRFVHLVDWGWDHHGVSPGEDIRDHLPIKARQIDRAMSALVLDLKQRGLLEETLIVWGGEFGRTPMQQNNRPDLPYVGRDHHPAAFTMWMAGGGVKAGLDIGATDELGHDIVESPISVRDFQATLLHLLGLDPYEFTVRHQGLDVRLIGPEGDARIRRELLA